MRWARQSWSYIQALAKARGTSFVWRVLAGRIRRTQRRWHCVQLLNDSRPVAAGCGTVPHARSSMWVPIYRQEFVRSTPHSSRIHSSALLLLGRQSRLLAIETQTANQTGQRTGASRFAHRQIQRHRRLAPVADLIVGGATHHRKTKRQL